MPAPVFSKFSFLDPALMARQIAAEHGSAVVTKWGFLDQHQMEQEIETALSVDGTFDKVHINDPKWTPDSLEVALF
jgi:hypothetical protein